MTTSHSGAPLWKVLLLAASALAAAGTVYGQWARSPAWIQVFAVSTGRVESGYEFFRITVKTRGRSGFDRLAIELNSSRAVVHGDDRVDFPGARARVEFTVGVPAVGAREPVHVVGWMGEDRIQEVALDARAD